MKASTGRTDPDTERALTQCGEALKRMRETLEQAALTMARYEARFADESRLEGKANVVLWAVAHAAGSGPNIDEANRALAELQAILEREDAP